MCQNLLVSAWALSTHGASEEGKLLPQEEIVLVMNKYTAFFSEPCGYCSETLRNTFINILVLWVILAKNFSHSVSEKLLPLSTLSLQRTSLR